MIPPSRLLLADKLDRVIARYYVYAHATELGAIRLGWGPKARIRFRSRSGCQARGASTLNRDWESA